MSQGIPEHVDLMRAVNLEAHFQGAIKVARMQRLAELLADKKGEIEIDVQFGLNEQKRPYISGRAHGQLWLPCQRCMQPMPEDIDVTFELMLFKSEHKALQVADDDIDVLVVEEVPASFFNIIEDELLLGFPAVYMHDESDCSATQYMQDKRDAQAEDQKAEKENPFDVLKDLKLDG